MKLFSTLIILGLAISCGNVEEERPAGSIAKSDVSTNDEDETVDEPVMVGGSFLACYEDSRFEGITDQTAVSCHFRTPDGTMIEGDFALEGDLEVTLESGEKLTVSPDSFMIGSVKHWVTFIDRDKAATAEIKVKPKNQKQESFSAKIKVPESAPDQTAPIVPVKNNGGTKVKPSSTTEAGGGQNSGTGSGTSTGNDNSQSIEDVLSGDDVEKTVNKLRKFINNPIVLHEFNQLETAKGLTLLLDDLNDLGQTVNTTKSLAELYKPDLVKELTTVQQEITDLRSLTKKLIKTLDEAKDPADKSHISASQTMLDQVYKDGNQTLTKSQSLYKRLKE